MLSAVARIERPLLPFAHLVEHRICDAADEVGRNRGPGQLGQVPLDLAHRHAAGVEAHDLGREPHGPPSPKKNRSNIQEIGPPSVSTVNRLRHSESWQACHCECRDRYDDLEHEHGRGNFRTMPHRFSSRLVRRSRTELAAREYTDEDPVSESWRLSGCGAASRIRQSADMGDQDCAAGAAGCDECEGGI